MISDNILNNEDPNTVVFQERLIRTKSKCATRNEICVELKPKKRCGKCVGAALIKCPEMVESLAKGEVEGVVYNTIHSVIWLHVADYITPEQIQSFAMICRQTADISFTPFEWILSLPEHLQANSLRDCDKSTMRTRVIECLFLTYEPLMERVKRGYALDKLLGNSYVSSWHEQDNCSWIMVLKFRQKTIKTDKDQTDYSQVLLKEDAFAEIGDWEALAEKPSPYKCVNAALKVQHNNNEGMSLLVISCERFVPFPDQLLYENSDTRITLLSTRQKLANDMRSFNVELDFSNTSKKVITTVKYCRVVNCKVYPWWHPDFRKYLK